MAGMLFVLRWTQICKSGEGSLSLAREGDATMAANVFVRSPAPSVSEAHARMESAVALVEELKNRKPVLQLERDALQKKRDEHKQMLEKKPNELQERDEATALVAAATANVDLAGARLDEARLRQSRMTIVAPVDGRVLSLVTSPGARLMLERGMSQGNDGMTVVTMYQPESLQIRVDVRFQDLPHVIVGQPVRIISPAVAAPLTGSVLFISSRADIQKNTLEVKVLIDDAPSVFKPEMLVDVTFLAPAESKSDGGSESADGGTEQMNLYVPKRLVAHDEAGSFVWTVDRSTGRAHVTRIETGVTAGEQIDYCGVGRVEPIDCWRSRGTFRRLPHSSRGNRRQRAVRNEQGIDAWHLSKSTT